MLDRGDWEAMGDGEQVRVREAAWWEGWLSKLDSAEQIRSH